MQARSLEPESSLPAPSQNPVVLHRWERRALWLAWVGLAWHVAEGGLAVAFGLAASSVALIGFGADSFIEAAAAVIIIWRLSRAAADAGVERRAAQLIAITFYLLAAYIVVESTRSLALGLRPDESLPGIALAMVTVVVMPPLARAKERAGAHIGSSATTSEGRQNLLCAYLSVALVVGLGANAGLGWWWADPLVALVIAFVAIGEGRRSWRGERDCCA